MRKDPLEIIEQMFKILEQEREAMSINQLAKTSFLAFRHKEMRLFLF